MCRAADATIFVLRFAAVVAAATSIITSLPLSLPLWPLIKRRACTDYLRWDTRRKALMEVVRELDADILCLQEVDNYNHFWVKELQHLGYTGEFLMLHLANRKDELLLD